MKIGLISAILILSSLAFYSCGEENNKDKGTNPTSQKHQGIVGSWQLYKEITNGKTSMLEKDEKLLVVWTFNEDGTYKIVTNGDLHREGLYTIDGKTLRITEHVINEYQFQLTGNDGMIMNSEVNGAFKVTTEHYFQRGPF